MQRMRELAVQSSNATNSATDRAALQAEVSQLTSEIDRVAKTSSFNGTKLLEGSFAGAVFQVGAAAGDNITVGSLVNATAGSIGKAAYTTSTLTLTVTADGLGAGSISIGSSTIKLAAASSVEDRKGQLLTALNSQTATTGVTAYQDGATIYLRSDAKTVTDNTLGAPAGAGGTITMTLDVATGTPTPVPPTMVVGAFALGDTNGLSAVTVNTQRDAWVALKKIDGAIDQVNSARGNLGALQTRFEKTVENIDIMNENISAARGRIVDADFAAETASLSRTQILQQAGTAMVAQANQLSQGVLSLLQ